MSLHNPQSRTREALWRGRIQGSIATAAAMIAIGLGSYAMTAIGSVTTIRPTPPVKIVEPIQHHHAQIPPCTDWAAKDCVAISEPSKTIPWAPTPHTMEPIPYMEQTKIHTVPEPSTFWLILGAICLMLVLSLKR